MQAVDGILLFCCHEDGTITSHAAQWQTDLVLFGQELIVRTASSGDMTELVMETERKNVCIWGS